MTRTAAAKASERRRRKKPAGLAAERLRRRNQRDRRPFVGVDGEGSGTDELGRQHYMLLRAGDMELFTGKPLTTLECLDFLCEIPPGQAAIPVGFAFGYDVTMILRDLDERQRYRVLGYTYDPETEKWKQTGHKPGIERYTYYKDFAIEYLPKNYLRIARTRRVPGVPGKGMGRKVIPGSSRTIYETFGFFQMSFVAALTAFEIGSPELRAEIKATKDQRSDFDAATDDVRRYCAMECDLLAELMAAFREVCLDADIRPRTWNGAGKLSKALHKRGGTPTADQVRQMVPAPVLAMASQAYYGGRFEVTRVGRIEGPIHEYDIRSAYPAAMAKSLPCLEHGLWENAPKQWLDKALQGASGEIYAAPVHFRHGSATPLCGLPVRRKDGRLFWPREGRGTYWSLEIHAASGLDCQAKATGNGWRYIRQCDCQPFAWMQRLYDYRRSIGSGTRGYPIKLGINGGYGTLAQRVGNPQYANMVWAGLITAQTRAWLMEAAATDPGAVIMLATDGLFSRRPLPVQIGAELGQWEHAEHASMFVVQPGLYWRPGKMKTRGVTSRFFPPPVIAQFEAAWSRYAIEDRAALFDAGGASPPIVAVELNLFIGLKIAQARGKPEIAGKWVRGQDAIRKFSFDWHGKRGPHRWESDTHIVTFPAPGGPDLVSQPHASDVTLIEGMDLERAELDDQPDFMGGPEFD